MSHELEIGQDGKASMAYVGDTPWHGLGQQLDDMRGLGADEQIDKMITAGRMDWDVELVPLVTADDHVDVPMARAVRRKSDHLVFGTVGAAYHSLQNRAAFEWFTPFLDEKLATLHTAGCLFDGRKVWVLAELTRDPLVIGKDDVIRKFLLLSNSHDGTTSVRVTLTPTRVVCWNTLSAAHADKVNSRFIRVRHTKKLQTNLEAIREIVDLADQEFRATGEQYKRLQNRHINQKDLTKYVRRVFEIETEPAKYNGQQQAMTGRVAELFETGKGTELPGVSGTYWAAFNAVTEYLSWERGKGQDTRLNSLWFGESARTNQRALQVALDMAG